MARLATAFATILAFAYLLPAGAQFAPVPGIDTLPKAAAAPAAPTAKSYLWEVSSLTNRVYLYGTVHAGKASFYPLPPAVDKAFAESKVLVVEADITDAAAMARSSGTLMLAPPDSLEKRLPRGAWERLRAQARRLGLPEAQVNQMKPFMAATLLAFSEWGRLGYTPIHGVDLNLIRRAKERALPILELEGAAAQAALVDSLTDDEALAALDGTLAALESGLTAEQVTGMVNAWQAGDPALLLEVARKYNDNVPGAARIEEKFIWSRHDEMARKIAGYLNDTKQRHFVAVGALHMAGPRGLLEMLKARGFLVRQL